LCLLIIVALMRGGKMYFCIKCCPEEVCDRTRVEDLEVIECADCGTLDLCCGCYKDFSTDNLPEDDWRKDR
jgi:hypothetical protein